MKPSLSGVGRFPRVFSPLPPYNPLTRYPLAKTGMSHQIIQYKVCSLKMSRKRFVPFILFVP